MSDTMDRRRTCVVVVSGGVVQGIYGDAMDAILVDFDNIEAGDEAGRYPTHSLSQLDESVRVELERAGITVQPALKTP